MLQMKPELVEQLDTPEGLREALQAAVMLEHSTIPTYLYALFSVDPKKNPTVSKIISSVVYEEMLHMALACNILNAVGGSPLIDDPSFVPTYPGPLPGTVEEGLTVPLAPFSVELVEKVFMVIEEPEDPLHFPDLLAADGKLTIGAFYGRIRQQIEEGGEPLFADRRRELQVTEPEGVIAVENVKTATEAIEMIVEQGEGTDKSPTDPLAGEELAHYYRFSEIVHGKELIRQGDSWAYAGKSIAVDPTGVMPLLENPTIESYPAGSPALKGVESFNRFYTELLQTLHKTFNGSPGSLGDAIDLMFSMRKEGLALAQTPSGQPGKNAGPTFEYQPSLS
jgi:rubrerythrin